MNRTSGDRSVINWLFTGCFLIALMVIIGGITRLTQSGLSMVEWKLIMGILPPLSEQEWLETFEKYKQFPEYQKINYSFTLEEFKSIFFWEYLHRVLGRTIGLVFIIPFVIFLLQKKVHPKLLPKLIFILFLGGFQGFLGWFMVKSGLVDNPHVSHYRLAIHLCAAFFLFSYTFWVALNEIRPSSKRWVGENVSKRLFTITGILIGAQIVYGAFVAGLKAGKFFNTYPTMDGQFIPDALMMAVDHFGWSSIFDNVAWVQFIHRGLAVLVAILVIVVGYRMIKQGEARIGAAGKLLVSAIILQFLLGVITLLLAVPVFMGVLHQFGALLLLTAYVFAAYTLREKNLNNS